MHGRLRSEERKKVKNAISDREIKRITGKLKSVLDSMVNQKKNTYDMELLNTDIDTVISSPRPVHNKITNWFSGWFSLDLKEKKPLHTDEDWLLIYQDKT